MTHLDKLCEEADWPVDGRFTFFDEPGEHDPCYVVMPGGSSLPVNHHAKPGVDIARAHFIVDACNAALATRTALAEIRRQAEGVDVPAGWRLVPVEPTEAMLLAGSTAWSDKVQNSPISRWSKAMRRVHKAMLSAAPEPPKALALASLMDEVVKVLEPFAEIVSKGKNVHTVRRSEATFTLARVEDVRRASDLHAKIIALRDGGK